MIRIHNILLPPTNESGVTRCPYLLGGENQVNISLKTLCKNESFISIHTVEIKGQYVVKLKIWGIGDFVLRLITPRGAPIVGALVKLSKVDVGMTDRDGKVLIKQIVDSNCSLVVKWFDVVLNLPSFIVIRPGIVTLSPTNVHTLTVNVLDAKGQALEGAKVKVMKDNVEVAMSLTDNYGKTEIELPDTSYIIEVSYGQFIKVDSASLTTDTVKTVNLDVFIKLFGIGMSRIQFTLFIATVIFIIIVLVSIILLYKHRIFFGKRNIN